MGGTKRRRLVGYSKNDCFGFEFPLFLLEPEVPVQYINNMYEESTRKSVRITAFRGVWLLKFKILKTPWK